MGPELLFKNNCHVEDYIMMFFVLNLSPEDYKDYKKGSEWKPADEKLKEEKVIIEGYGLGDVVM